MNPIDNILTYDGQLDFKKWARKEYHLPDFYFDYITCVDAKDDRDIEGVVADGSMTWGEAADYLVTHFM